MHVSLVSGPNRQRNSVEINIRLNILARVHDVHVYTFVSVSVIARSVDRNFYFEHRGYSYFFLLHRLGPSVCSVPPKIPGLTNQLF